MTNHALTVTNPQNAIDAFLLDAGSQSIQFKFDFKANYEPNPTTLRLFCECRKSPNGLYLGIGSGPENLQGEVNLSLPLPLQPVQVPKPWGEEIWYSGIEARGVSSINNLPISWLIAVCPDLFMGTADAAPILLKILAPHPVPVLGDLYFELHTDKTEVYVVTAVDPSAWPDGKGQIRYGFNPEKLRTEGNEEQFKKAYLQSVEAYQLVRTQIDRMLDDLKEKDGYQGNDVVPVSLLQQWRQKIDPRLLSQEEHLRQEMESFTHALELMQGDILRVQQRTPHSLQHGVRVVEFQSPHYERFILSFGQKVLTQNHWDTHTAINLAIMTPEKPVQPVGAFDTNGIQIDEVASFTEFQVQRVTLLPGASLTNVRETYCLCMGISGNPSINSVMVEPEQALFIPAMNRQTTMTNNGANKACLLIAFPIIDKP